MQTLENFAGKGAECEFDRGVRGRGFIVSILIPVDLHPICPDTFCNRKHFLYCYSLLLPSPLDRKNRERVSWKVAGWLLISGKKCSLGGWVSWVNGTVAYSKPSPKNKRFLLFTAQKDFDKLMDTFWLSGRWERKPDIFSTPGLALILWTGPEKVESFRMLSSLLHFSHVKKSSSSAGMGRPPLNSGHWMRNFLTFECSTMQPSFNLVVCNSFYF